MHRFVVLLALVFLPALARAEPAADKNNEAVRLGRDALAAFQRGDWSGAHDGFASAEALTHSPVFVLYMARARRNAGALLEARELYTRVAADDLAADAPVPWRTAVTDGAAEMGELSRRIPSISIEPGALEPGDVVLVDQKSVSPERLRGEIELDPGPHVVTLRKGTKAPIEKEVRLPEGARGVVVAFELDAPPPPIALSPAAKPPPASSPEVLKPDREAVDAPKDRYGTAALVTGIVGLAGVAFGSVTGIVALTKYQSIKKHCDGNVCPEKYEGDARIAGNYAALSTVGFVVGGVGLGASATLRWVLP